MNKINRNVKKEHFPKLIKNITAVFISFAVLLQIFVIQTAGVAGGTISAEFETIYGNGDLSLLFNPETGIISVKDHKNGYIWKSIIDEQVYDLSKLNDKWKAYVSSALTINYVDLTKKDASMAIAYSSTDSKLLKVEHKQKGFNTEYDFENIGIRLTIEYILEGDSLIVRIPADKIQGKKNFGLVSAELMPYFGAAGRKVDGYIMYPETAQKWQDMADNVADRQRLVAVEGGNVYMLKYADRLYDIPMESSNYFISDESIPFYQMVVHGMIPYSSEPGNLSYDLKNEKLKWVEYGCMPYFELTYTKPGELKDTQYNRLFTSYYNDWYSNAYQ